VELLCFGNRPPPLMAPDAMATATSPCWRRVRHRIQEVGFRCVGRPVRSFGGFTAQAWYARRADRVGLQVGIRSGRPLSWWFFFFLKKDSAPHEWSLGKGITEVKSYLRRNSAEKQLRTQDLVTRRVSTH
jgi:hypothetical protein